MRKPTETVTTFNGQAPNFGPQGKAEFGPEGQIPPDYEGQAPSSAEGQAPSSAEGQAEFDDGDDDGETPEQAIAWQALREKHAAENRAAMKAQADEFGEMVAAHLAPVMVDFALSTLAASAMTGLLARRDSPCALNPDAIAMQSVEYARATLKALKAPAP